jgi:hypothetical protein
LHRDAIPIGQHPEHVIPDNDSTHGAAFARLAKASGIQRPRTAYHAPEEDASAERFLWVLAAYSWTICRC